MAADETFTQAFLGSAVLESAPFRAFRRLSPTAQVAAIVIAMGAVLYLPFLGAGLFDCWETHYGEVARQMIHRRDYVFPYWENAFFFSKPVLAMWMMALGQLVAGTDGSPEPGVVSGWTEWGMRLPFVALSVTALVLVAVAVSRVVNRRAGLASAFVLATMPLYLFLTRQTITDTPFVASFTCAMACAAVGLLDRSPEGNRQSSGWWYGFYLFCGLATLAKGLLGIALPAAILLAYAAVCVVPWDADGGRRHLRWLWDREMRSQVRLGIEPMPELWAELFRMRFLTGVLLFLAVALPWYLTLSLFQGVDDEGRTFFTRFFIYDHLNRLTAGVHTTSPRSHFTYFIEQAGYAAFPWVALIPGVLGMVVRLRPRTLNPWQQLSTLAALWGTVVFALIASSATQFFHYIFPALPALAILCGLYIDRLWREGQAGIAGQGFALILGGLLFALVARDLFGDDHFLIDRSWVSLPGVKHFADLFLYNPERPYPKALMGRTLLVFGRADHPLLAGQLAAVSLFAIAGYLVFEAWNDLKRPTSTWIAAFLSAGLGGLLFGLRTPSLMRPVTVQAALVFSCVLFGVLLAVSAALRSRAMLFGTFWTLALSFALWCSWNHWERLSQHWTQRELFDRYYQLRLPGEPVAAYLMNWRGETFYSRNRVKQIRDAPKLTQYAAQPGREWALVEHNRLGLLKTAVGADKKVTPVEAELNNKFVLVSIE